MSNKKKKRAIDELINKREDNQAIKQNISARTLGGFVDPEENKYAASFQTTTIKEDPQKKDEFVQKQVEFKIENEIKLDEYEKENNEQTEEMDLFLDEKEPETVNENELIEDFKNNSEVENNEHNEKYYEKYIMDYGLDDTDKENEFGLPDEFFDEDFKTEELDDIEKEVVNPKLTQLISKKFSIAVEKLNQKKEELIERDTDIDKSESENNSSERTPILVYKSEINPDLKLIKKRLRERHYVDPESYKGINLTIGQLQKKFKEAELKEAGLYVEEESSEEENAEPTVNEDSFTKAFKGSKIEPIDNIIKSTPKKEKVSYYYIADKIPAAYLDDDILYLPDVSYEEFREIFPELTHEIIINSFKDITFISANIEPTKREAKLKQIDIIEPRKEKNKLFNDNIEEYSYGYNEDSEDYEDEDEVSKENYEEYNNKYTEKLKPKREIKSSEKMPIDVLLSKKEGPNILDKINNLSATEIKYLYVAGAVIALIILIIMISVFANKPEKTKDSKKNDTNINQEETKIIDDVSTNNNYELIKRLIPNAIQKGEIIYLPTSSAADFLQRFPEFSDEASIKSKYPHLYFKFEDVDFEAIKMIFPTAVLEGNILKIDDVNFIEFSEAFPMFKSEEDLKTVFSDCIFRQAKVSVEQMEKVFPDTTFKNGNLNLPDATFDDFRNKFPEYNSLAEMKLDYPKIKFKAPPVPIESITVAFPNATYNDGKLNLKDTSFEEFKLKFPQYSSYDKLLKDYPNVTFKE